MKETFYFSHDYNAMQDPKMMELWGECGLEGIGFYWILIEALQGEPTSRISDVQLKVLLKMYYDSTHGEHMFNKILQMLNTTGLLLKDDENYNYSLRVLEHKKRRNELIEKRSKAGKISARVRSNKRSTCVEHKPNKESKVKERKGKGCEAATPPHEHQKKDSKFFELALLLSEKMARGIAYSNPAFQKKFDVEKNNPLKKDLQKKVEKWADDVEKLLRIDRADTDEVSIVIGWIYSSTCKDAMFWKNNILSGAKLREHYQRLVALAITDSQSKKLNIAICPE